MNPAVVMVRLWHIVLLLLLAVDFTNMSMQALTLLQHVTNDASRMQDLVFYALQQVSVAVTSCVSMTDFCKMKAMFLRFLQSTAAICK